MPTCARCSAGRSERGRLRLRRRPVQRDPGHDQRDACDLRGARDLREDDDSDDRGGGRQERDEQRVGRPRQPRERELIGDVWDDRGGDADPDAGEQPYGIGEHRQGLPPADRRHGHRGDEHRRGERVDPAELRPLGDAGRRARCRQRRSAALAKAKARPRGCASIRMPVRRWTPGTASTSVPAFRGVRAPSAASRMTGRNSIAATVPSGSRSIAAGVHERQHAAPGQQQPPAATIQAGPRLPGPAPDGENHGGGGDPQPRDPEHVDAREEQDGERGPR